MEKDSKISTAETGQMNLSERTEEQAEPLAAPVVMQEPEFKAPANHAAMAAVPGLLETSLPAFDQPLSFKQMWQMASIMGKSSVVPQAWRNPNDAFVGITLAMQMKMHPLVFMQHAYPVQGKVRIEGKFVKTLIDLYGPYVNGLEVEDIVGDGDKRSITVHAERRNGKVDKLTFSVADAKRAGWTGNFWQKLPDQMLRYRAYSLFCDAFCQNVRMGLQTIEEAHDIDGVTVLGSARQSQAKVLEERL